MGKYINLEEISIDRDHHIIPKNLSRYDHRNPVPWPNELFPYGLIWYWGERYYSDTVMFTRVRLRRFIEQQCEGDVAIGDNRQKTMRLWFEYEHDMVLVKLTWSEWLTK